MMVLYGGSSGAVAPLDPLVLTQKGSISFTALIGELHSSLLRSCRPAPVRCSA